METQFLYTLLWNFSLYMTFRGTARIQPEEKVIYHEIVVLEFVAHAFESEPGFAVSVLIHGHIFSFHFIKHPWPKHY